MKENSTIAAIATALSPAGISIIRISGPQALDVIDRIYRTKKEVESIKKGAFAAAVDARQIRRVDGHSGHKRARHPQRKSSQMHLHIPFITAIFVMKMR